MPGRTSDVSVSTFKPLSLQEIMMVPLAKQKMEDEFLAGTDKVNELEASTLKGDQEKASEILGKIKDEASLMSQEVIDRGISRSQFNKLRDLRSRVKKEYGSEGFLGNALANKKAASSYINDLATKKERQAGWSPADAKKWAQIQVSKFGSTLNEDGSFNNFSGKELDLKVDEAEWIRKNIDDVAEQVQDSSLRMIKTGGLPAFQRAFAQKEVSGKDYNTIMRHLSQQANTDFDLQKSLLQGASINGEEDALDFGGFKKETYVKKDGTKGTRNVWEMGKGRFGRRMAGAADAADYMKTKLNYKIIKDDVGFSMWKSGMETKQAMRLVGFGNGEETDISRANLEELRENVQLASEETEIMLGDLNKEKSIILNNNSEYQDLKNKLNSKNLISLEYQNKIQEDLDKMESAILEKNSHYQKLKTDYTNASIKWSNAKFSIESVYENAREKMNPSQRQMADMSILVEEIPGYDVNPTLALENEIRTLPGGENIVGDFGINQVGVGEDETHNYLLSKFLELKGYEVKNDSNAKSFLSFLNEKDMMYDKDIVNKMYKGKRILNNRVDGERAANPHSQSYKTITANDVGGAKAPVVARNNNILKKSLIKDNITMAFGKGKLTDAYIISQIEESDKGYDYTPQMTESWDNKASKIVNLVVTNLQTSKTTTIPIVNNNNRENDIAVADEFISSNIPKFVKMGNKIKNGYKYMPHIKKSNMPHSDKGQIGGIPFKNKSTGDPLFVEWVKSKDKTHYTASIAGFPLKNGQAIYGETDMLKVISDYVEEKRLKAINKK